MGVKTNTLLTGLFSLVFFSVSHSAAAAVVTVATGTVTSDQGPALSGVAVECHTSNGSFTTTSTTNGSGVYTCTDDTTDGNVLNVGQSVTLEVHTPPEGYNAPNAHQFTWDGSTAETYNFELISAPYTVNVTVHDTEGNPIEADVIVQPINIEPGDNATQATGATSDETGTDSIAVSFTDAIVMAEANLSEQNAERYPWVAIGGAQKVQFSDSVTSVDLEFTVVRSNTKVTVTMQDADGANLTGNDFNGDVYFEGYNETYGSVSTRRKVNQSTGEAQVYLLPGIWHVTAIHPQLENQSYDPDETTFVVSDEAGTTALGTIRATENTGSISGKVTINIANGDTKDLNGVMVEIVNLDTNNRFSSNIQPNGNFAVQHVGLGSYSLTVSGAQIIPTGSATVELTSGKNTIENVALSADQANQVLEGTLKIGETPVENFEGTVVVETANGEFSAPVSPDGSYSIPMFTGGISGDDVTLKLLTQAGADGYAQSKEFSITNADPSVNLALKTDEATITGSVKNDAGETVNETVLGEGAMISAINTQTGSVESAQVASDGSYSIEVGPGTWNLVPDLGQGDAEVYAGATSGTSVKVAAGASVTKNVTVLRETANISGTITNADGDPVPEAPVVITNLPALKAAGNVDPSDVVSITTTADSSGNVDIDVPAGKYTLQFGTTPEIDNETAPDSKVVTVTASTDATFDAEFQSNGNTKFQGKVAGGFALATVTAYSSDGGSVSTDVNKSGNYTLSVTPGEWNVVVAAQKDGELFLQQTKVTAKAGKNSKDFAPAATGLDFPAAVSVTADADELITVANAEGAQVTLPAYSAAFSGEVTVTLAPVVEFNNTSEQSQLGIAYDVRVVDDSGIPVTTLNQPATVELPLDQQLNGGVGSKAVTAAYYNDAMGSNLFDGITSNVQDDKLVIQTTHFSQFSATTSGNVTYAPNQVKQSTLASSAITSSSAKLAWAKPAASTVKRYKLQVRKQGVAKQKQWTNFTTTQTNRVVTQLLSKTAYEFRVQACNASGCGSYSAWKKFTTL